MFDYSSDCVSDLVGELQELQSGTNTSTAADLLKQGAGEFIFYFIFLCINGWRKKAIYKSLGLVRFLFLKVSYAHQVFTYLNKNTVKTLIT